MDKHNLLHPPLPVKNLKKKDQVLLIKRMENGIFDVAFLDADFKELPKSMDVPVKDISKFLDSVHCRNLKAVIFYLADFTNGPLDFEVRRMVNEEVKKRKWHICLIDPERVSIMSMLFSSKIDSKPGDVILNVSNMDGQKIAVSELRRKLEGYSHINFRMVNRFNGTINDVAAEILSTCNPEYVIVSDPQNNDLLMSLKSLVVPSEKVINVDPENIVEYTQQALKTIYDHGYSQVIPFSMDKLAVTNVSNFTVPEQAMITVERLEDLPLKKVQIVPKSKKPYYVAYRDNTLERYKPAVETLLLKEQREHRIRLTLVVGQNTLPYLIQESFIIPEIQALPKKLASSKADLNVPVIAFFDNSSVICVRDENGYKFLNEWNGLYGNDLYLSFEEEEPIIVTDLNKVKDIDPFVVYDLVKVLSMPANILKIDPKWGFKVTSDAENSVLLQFETFLGSRKATPVSLMVYFLKYHIKAIVKETGKKPKELGFCLFNQFTKKEKKRIKTGLEEACKLLKIDFVFVPNV